MTQCWQHCPDHRPNFSTILERINYCTQVDFILTLRPLTHEITRFHTFSTHICVYNLNLVTQLCLNFYQDPDVINTPLPVEYSPNTEDDGSIVMRPPAAASHILNPLLVSRPMCQELPPQLGFSPKGFTAPVLPPQPTKPRLLLQRTHPVHHEVTSCCELLEPSWAETVPAPGHDLHPEPPHHPPCSRSSSSSGSQRLKNKTKNLWNPTYGSWVLESFRGKKTLVHTQSVPLSSNTPNAQPCSSPPESNKAVCSSTYLSSISSSTCQVQADPASPKNSVGATSNPGMNLAKLQSFPCGNVNYAYDDQSYEAESLPMVTSKASETITSTSSAPGVPPGTCLSLTPGCHTSSSSMPKLPLKRHSSYGHEDMRRHTKIEKPTRDRDSGFSLSEDLPHLARI